MLIYPFITITLLEHYDTTPEKLQSSNHRPGPGCVCLECENLKELESKWIHRLGTLHGPFGLRNCLEISTRKRASYWCNRRWPTGWLGAAWHWFCGENHSPGRTCSATPPCNCWWLQEPADPWTGPPQSFLFFFFYFLMNLWYLISFRFRNLDSPKCIDTFHCSVTKL